MMELPKGHVLNTNLACTAYTRYILDIGHSEDWIGLQMAIAPCLLGYGAIAEQLNADPNSKREGNRYWPWIENYLAEDYLIAVETGTGKPLCGWGQRLCC